MAVDDHGLEVLKKSGEEVTPGDKSDYVIKTLALQNFGPPKEARAFTVIEGTDFTTYQFRESYPSGTVLKQVKLYYSDASKEDFIGGEIL